MEFFKGKGQKGNNPAKVDSRNRTLRRVSLFSAVIFIASLLVFNLLFDSLLGSKLKWDWSFGKMYSIGDVTRSLLAGMDKNVQITGLYEKGADSNLAKIERVLEDYVQYSNGKIEVRYVDMDADPNIVKDLDPSGIKQFSAGTFVVKNMETKRLKIVTQEDLFQIDTEAYYNTGAVNIIGLTAESGFSGAIKYVTALVTPTVYSLQGHGEEDLAAYTRISTILQEYNSVDLDKTMNLSVNPVIPEN
ncbi:MAG TPA: Gldg family protein, partial [Clostridia bacterium]